ncbi:MAG: arylsulfatase [Burkholderiales bacterium]|nr:arylsulfatase [Burkholderiales bacterium]
MDDRTRTGSSAPSVASRYRGKIGRTFADSAPWWPAPIRAPCGAPNIVIVYLDDVGFSDFGCYGSEIPTPNLDRLAAQGLRFTGYTTVPMCTPARAALLTGKNPHAVGCGWLNTSDPGYPGYGGEIARDAPTIAELLRANGYSTIAVGKWHNTREHNVSAAGDRSSWPLQRGFDRFYGFLAAETSYFHPEALREGNQLADIDSYPPGYYITDDLTDRAIRWLREHVSADPGKPFFLYLPYNAAHVPLHAKPADMARHCGRYDRGWDVIRAERFARQRALGVVSASARLPPSNPGVRAWTALSPDERRVYPKYMEAFAAIIDNVDQNVGRLVASLGAMGVLDDTLILVSVDNGANSLGARSGALNAFDQRFGKEVDPVLLNAMMANGEFGGPQTFMAYPSGWAQVSNTPFRQYKRYPMNGGIRVPFIARWPRGIAEPGAIRPQWIHVTDVCPTLLDIVGIPYPETFDARPALPLDGVSFKAVLTGANAPCARRAQSYELEGHRGFIEDGWKIVSLQPPKTRIDLDNWMLFDLDNDPTEIDDRARSEPAKLAQMVAAFEADAAANRIYPIDNRGFERGVAHPPHRMDEVNRPRTFHPGTQTIDRCNVWPLFADRTFRLTARFHFQPGESGVIFSLGTTFGGMVAFVADDALIFIYQRWRNPLELDPIALAPGACELVLDYRAHGQRRGSGRIRVNGVDRTPEIDMSPTLGRLPHEGMDVGIDRRCRTSERYAAHGSFAYGGTIEQVRVEPGPQAPDSIFNRVEVEAQQAALEWMR